MNKMKFNINRNPISTDEILKHKNFESTLKAYQTAKFPMLNNLNSWFLGGVIVVGIAFFGLWKMNSSPEQENIPTMEVVPPVVTNIPTESVQSPFPEMDISYETFTIDPTRAEILTTKSGSTIFIEKNSLDYINKGAAEGLVQIKYREFRNAKDFFLSGIPMEYDSAGTTYTFESAGMFELLAEQNGVELELSKDIEIQFVADKKDESFNFYRLDEATGNWVVLDTNIPVDVEETEDNTNANSLLAEKPMPIEPKIPVIYNKCDENTFVFKLESDPEEFPELNEYQGTVFQVNEDKTPFDAALYNVNWKDIELSRTALQNEYNLELIRKDTSIQLIVFPAIEPDKYLEAQQVFDSKMEAYEKSLSEYNSKVVAIKNTITRRELLKLPTSNLSRSLRVRNTGFHNCDRPIMVYPQKKINPILVDENEEEIKWDESFAFNSNWNAMFRQSRSSNYLYKNGKNILWVVLPDNQMVVLDENATAQIYKRPRGKYSVTKMNKEDALAYIDQLILEN